MPPWAWTTLYYAAALLVYRYLVHPYIHHSLERQILGAGDTLGTAAAALGYLLACLVPPYAWSRAGSYHPFWRGVETFVCYAAVALALGSLFTLGKGEEWRATSGICAGGPAWASVGSIAALFLAFQAASWWGSMGAAGSRGRRGKAARAGSTSR